MNADQVQAIADHIALDHCARLRQQLDDLAGREHVDILKLITRLDTELALIRERLDRIEEANQ